MSKKVKGYYNFITVEVDQLKADDSVIAIPNKKQFDYKDWNEFFYNTELDFSLKQLFDVVNVTKRKIALRELGLCNYTGAWHTQWYTKKEIREKYSFIRISIDERKIWEIFYDLINGHPEISKEDKIITIETLKKAYSEYIKDDKDSSIFNDDISTEIDEGQRYYYRLQEIRNEKKK